MGRYKIGTVREFAEQLADKNFYAKGDNGKDYFDFIFFDDLGLSIEDATDEAIDSAIDDSVVFWYGAQAVQMFDCNYICFGEWGGDSGVAITSPDDIWYAKESRETYIESIMDKVLEVGERNWEEHDNTMIIWE